METLSCWRACDSEDSRAANSTAVQRGLVSAGHRSRTGGTDSLDAFTAGGGADSQNTNATLGIVVYARDTGTAAEPFNTGPVLTVGLRSTDPQDAGPAANISTPSTFCSWL